MLLKKEIISSSGNILLHYTIAYNKSLNGMVERRMRQSIFAVASFWYTAWVNAGQPDLTAWLPNHFLKMISKNLKNLMKNGKAVKLKEGKRNAP